MPKFAHKPTMIDAVRVEEPMTLYAGAGITNGLVGDWLITYPDGIRRFMENKAFRAQFLPSDDAAEELLRE